MNNPKVTQLENAIVIDENVLGFDLERSGENDEGENRLDLHPYEHNTVNGGNPMPREFRSRSTPTLCSTSYLTDLMEKMPDHRLSDGMFRCVLQ